MPLASADGLDTVQRLSNCTLLAMPTVDAAPDLLHQPGSERSVPPRGGRPGHGNVSTRRGFVAGRPLRAAVTAACTVAGALLLGGCAALPPARMALPEALGTGSPEPVQGLGAGRSGTWTLGAWRGQFDRGRDRLALFDALAIDRATTRYELFRPDGAPVQAACRGRQTSASIGIVNAAARPFTVDCTWGGATTASMSLVATPASAVPRAERRGTFRSGDTSLELESVHRVEGSPLSLDAPIGYLISHAGRPVGAIELNGTTPRLWRPVAGTPLHEPVTLAALALALIWDPAATP